VCLSEFDKEEIRNYISAVGMYSAVDFTSNCVSFIVCILCVFIIPIFTRESRMLRTSLPSFGRPSVRPSHS